MRFLFFFQCVLAAIIIVALKGMFRQFLELPQLWKLSKIDFVRSHMKCNFIFKKHLTDHTWSAILFKKKNMILDFSSLSQYENNMFYMYQYSLFFFRTLIHILEKCIMLCIYMLGSPYHRTAYFPFLLFLVSRSSNYT